jgi:hypothetical protein
MYQFKKLRCLVMKENPVCKLDTYTVTLYAHLKQLKFLDYELINPQAVAAAHEEKHEELHEIEEKERMQEWEEEKAAERAKKEAINVDANLGAWLSLIVACVCMRVKV